MCQVKKEMQVKKRVVRKTRRSSLQKEIDILLSQTPDIELPEPESGSPFQRRGYVECISNKGHESQIEVGKAYRIQELGLDESSYGNSFSLSGCEEELYFDSSLFKSINNGPFLVDDNVNIQGFSDVQDLTGNGFPDGLIDSDNGVVISATGTHAVVSFGTSYRYLSPNENLVLMKRYNKQNSKFKSGDQVVCIKHNDYITYGKMFKVESIRDTDIALQGHNRMYPSKWFKSTKLKPKAIKSISMEDHIRNYINARSYEKVTASMISKSMLEDNITGADSITLSDIRKVMKTTFKWVG